MKRRKQQYRTLWLTLIVAALFAGFIGYASVAQHFRVEDTTAVTLRSKIEDFKGSDEALQNLVTDELGTKISKIDLANTLQQNGFREVACNAPIISCFHYEASRGLVFITSIDVVLLRQAIASPGFRVHVSSNGY